VDCGAIGGICGSYIKVLENSELFADVMGLAGHKVSQLCVATAQALFTMHKGDVIATSIKWHFLVKGRVHHHACRWKCLEQI
jgi:hypothetical protein